jgi:hypothetical protein
MDWEEDVAGGPRGRRRVWGVPPQGQHHKGQAAIEPGVGEEVVVLEASTAGGPRGGRWQGPSCPRWRRGAGAGRAHGMPGAGGNWRGPGSLAAGETSAGPDAGPRGEASCGCSLSRWGAVVCRLIVVGRVCSHSWRRHGAGQQGPVRVVDGARCRAGPRWRGQSGPVASPLLARTADGAVLW